LIEKAEEQVGVFYISWREGPQTSLEHPLHFGANEKVRNHTEALI
jgi:hypothetical protein